MVKDRKISESSNSSRWKKGHIPWNKGKKGVQVSWIKGKTHSKETREKLSKSKKGVPLPHTPKDRTCKNCDKTYKTESNNQKYCQKCFYIELTCGFCDNPIKQRRTYYEFHSKRNKEYKPFCSTKCSAGIRKTTEPRTCKECNKEFECAKSSTRKFCCRNCYDNFQYTQEKRLCLWCDKPFMANPNGTQRYCCKRCALASTGETMIETKVREQLELKSLVFEQYKQIDSFYVDFYLPEHNIIIECDGEYWHTKPEVVERDKRKNELLEQEGYTVFRFTDKEINSNLDECMNKVYEVYKSKT